MISPAGPALSYLSTVTVKVGPAIEVGDTPDGFRRIIPILGGAVQGPVLRGKVLPAGADYQLLKSETLTELEAKYVIETDDGEHIYITNFGLRAGSAENIARLVRGEFVDPNLIYFRCTPRMVSAGRWGWLGSRLIIGSGERLPDAVRLHLYVVE